MEIWIDDRIAFFTCKCGSEIHVEDYCQDCLMDYDDYKQRKAIRE